MDKPAPFSITRTMGGVVLKVEGALTIRHAQDLAAGLAEYVDDGAPLRVDTGDLEDIDTCILQLLCSLRKTVPALSFEDPSEVFMRAADRCGLRRELLATRESA
jgi:anti-anti-sigma regulatory factor